MKCFKGIGLLDLIELASGYIEVHALTCILFIASVCDMTVKNRNYRQIALKYTLYWELCDHMSLLFQQARSIVNQKFPGIRVGFGGLCGFDFNRYNRIQSISPLQNVINRVVDFVNHQILNDNIFIGIVHPTLTRKIHRRSRKYGYPNQYRLLYDSLHLSKVVNEEWVKNIARYHDNNHQRFDG